jgi:hypothetical protein
MTKAKNSDDLNEIIAEQLDILSSGKATAEDCQKANAIGGLIGKQLKKDAVRLAYYNQRKVTPPRIDAFEGREEGKKTRASAKGGEI